MPQLKIKLKKDAELILFKEAKWITVFKKESAGYNKVSYNGSNYICGIYF